MATKTEIREEIKLKNQEIRELKKQIKEISQENKEANKEIESTNKLIAKEVTKFSKEDLENVIHITNVAKSFKEEGKVTKGSLIKKNELKRIISDNRERLVSLNEFLKISPVTATGLNGYKKADVSKVSMRALLATEDLKELTSKVKKLATNEEFDISAARVKLVNAIPEKEAQLSKIKEELKAATEERAKILNLQIAKLEKEITNDFIDAKVSEQEENHRQKMELFNALENKDKIILNSSEGVILIKL